MATEDKKKKSTMDILDYLQAEIPDATPREEDEEEEDEDMLLPIPPMKPRQGIMR